MKQMTFFPAVPVYCNTAAILPKQANMNDAVLKNKTIAVKICAVGFPGPTSTSDPDV